MIFVYLISGGVYTLAVFILGFWFGQNCLAEKMAKTKDVLFNVGHRILKPEGAVIKNEYGTKEVG